MEADGRVMDRTGDRGGNRRTPRPPLPSSSNGSFASNSTGSKNSSRHGADSQSICSTRATSGKQSRMKTTRANDVDDETIDSNRADSLSSSLVVKATRKRFLGKKVKKKKDPPARGTSKKPNKRTDPPETRKSLLDLEEGLNMEATSNSVGNDKASGAATDADVKQIEPVLTKEHSPSSTSEPFQDSSFQELKDWSDTASVAAPEDTGTTELASLVLSSDKMPRSRSESGTAGEYNDYAGALLHDKKRDLPPRNKVKSIVEPPATSQMAVGNESPAGSKGSRKESDRSCSSPLQPKKHVEITVVVSPKAKKAESLYQTVVSPRYNRSGKSKKHRRSASHGEQVSPKATPRPQALQRSSSDRELRADEVLIPAADTSFTRMVPIKAPASTVPVSSEDNNIDLEDSLSNESSSQSDSFVQEAPSPTISSTMQWLGESLCGVYTSSTTYLTENVCEDVHLTTTISWLSSLQSQTARQSDKQLSAPHVVPNDGSFDSRASSGRPHSPTSTMLEKFSPLRWANERYQDHLKGCRINPRAALSPADAKASRTDATSGAGSFGKVTSITTTLLSNHDDGGSSSPISDDAGKRNKVVRFASPLALEQIFEDIHDDESDQFVRDRDSPVFSSDEESNSILSRSDEESTRTSSPFSSSSESEKTSSPNSVMSSPPLDVYEKECPSPVSSPLSFTEKHEKPEKLNARKDPAAVPNAAGEANASDQSSSLLKVADTESEFQSMYDELDDHVNAATFDSRPTTQTVSVLKESTNSKGANNDQSGPGFDTDPLKIDAELNECGDTSTLLAPDKGFANEQGKKMELEALPVEPTSSLPPGMTSDKSQSPQRSTSLELDHALDSDLDSTPDKLTLIAQKVVTEEPAYSAPILSSEQKLESPAEEVNPTPTLLDFESEINDGTGEAASGMDESDPFSSSFVMETEEAKKEERGADGSLNDSLMSSFVMSRTITLEDDKIVINTSLEERQSDFVAAGRSRSLPNNPTFLEDTRSESPLTSIGNKPSFETAFKMLEEEHFDFVTSFFNDSPSRFPKTWPSPPKQPQNFSFEEEIVAAKPLLLETSSESQKWRLSEAAAKLVAKNRLGRIGSGGTAGFSSHQPRTFRKKLVVESGTSDPSLSSVGTLSSPTTGKLPKRSEPFLLDRLSDSTKRFSKDSQGSGTTDQGDSPIKKTIGSSSSLPQTARQASNPTATTKKDCSNSLPSKPTASSHKDDRTSSLPSKQTYASVRKVESTSNIKSTSNINNNTKASSLKNGGGSKKLLHIRPRAFFTSTGP